MITSDIQHITNTNTTDIQHITNTNTNTPISHTLVSFIITSTLSIPTIDDPAELQNEADDTTKASSPSNVVADVPAHEPQQSKRQKHEPNSFGFDRY
jgi:hypothetical protein